MKTKLINFTQSLIARKSVTPIDDGAIKLLQESGNVFLIHDFDNKVLKIDSRPNPTNKYVFFDYSLSKSIKFIGNNKSIKNFFINYADNGLSF